MDPKKAKQQPVKTGNIIDNQIISSKEPFIQLLKKYCFDKRLSPSAKNVLIMLKALPPKWEFKISRTATFMNISKNTLKSALKELEKNHYLEVLKINNNLFSYSVVDPLELDESGFNPLSIFDYTDKQRWYFYRSDKTKQEYKDLIDAFIKLEYKQKGVVSYNDFLGLMKKYCPEEYKLI